MQVILLEHMKKLGNIGDVIDVKSGFGRNYLIPSGKALQASKSNIALFESKRAEIEAQNAQKLEEAKKVAAKLDGKFVTIIQQAGEDGRLYGSVGAALISKEATTQTGQQVKRTQVVTFDALKYLGVYDAEIVLHAQASANILINIARTEDEAAKARDLYKQGGKEAVATSLGLGGVVHEEEFFEQEVAVESYDEDAQEQQDEAPAA